MKNIKTIAEILRFAGIKARADYKTGAIKVKGLTEEVKAKIEELYKVEVVAAQAIII